MSAMSVTPSVARSNHETDTPPLDLCVVCVCVCALCMGVLDDRFRNLAVTYENVAGGLKRVRAGLTVDVATTCRRCTIFANRWGAQGGRKPKGIECIQKKVWTSNKRAIVRRLCYKLSKVYNSGSNIVQFDWDSTVVWRGESRYKK
jgi:hypothetical protein